MGSISSSLPTLTFTGQSSFANDLLSSLNRAIQIASLPVQLMQSQVSSLQSQQGALTGLQSAFSSLQSAIGSIGSASGGTLLANVSDSSVATATAAGALPGTYSIQVDHVGTSTSTLSKAGLTTVTDPTTGNISSSSSFTLTVNGTAFTISPTTNTLTDLAAAINDAGAGVQATIVNVGGASNPDYRLALTGTSVGDTTIQLNDGTSDLLDTLSAGTNAEYSVPGSNIQVESTSNQITLAPGLTVNLLEASSSPITITVGADFSSLSNTLSNFVSAYNSALSSVNQQIGENAGPLAGQSVVYTLRNTLSDLATYTGGPGAVNNLASMGLTVDSTGQMSFDATVFSTQSTAAIQQFLGGITSGGFLQTASDALAAVADPTSGAIQSQFDFLQTEVDNENDLIANEEVRINDLATNLQQQLSQADAVIANLEAQKTYYTQLFQAQFPSSSATG